MGSIIQVARGSLSKIENEREKLTQGELFWIAKNTNGENPKATAWDEGTLYLGDPSLLEDGTRAPIAGVRSYKSLVHRGDINFDITDITDDKFLTAREGDFYIFNEESPSGDHSKGEGNTFFEKDDFHDGDILLITGSVWDIDTGLTDTASISYRRITTGTGYAEEIHFDDKDTDLSAKYVNEAIKELEVEKMSYRGTIKTQAQLNALIPERGTLYLVLTDDLEFSQKAGEWEHESIKKGDFVYCLNQGEYWYQIPSGNTNAEDIDYNQYIEQRQALAQALQSNVSEGVTTFNTEHINAFLNDIKTVKQALDYMAVHKAQLDASGKVPLSQLHATVLGSLQYKGIWNPLTGECTNIADAQKVEFQADWPKTGKDEYGNNVGTPSNGDYYIVQIDNPGFSKDEIHYNINYADKDSDNGDGTYSRYLELNNGDYIIFQQSDDEDGSDTSPFRWSVIDNSDRISTIQFIIDAYINGNDALKLTNAKEISLVNAPKFAADHKIGLSYDDMNKVTIEGIRLIDQILDKDGSDYALPRYSAGKHNTIEDSHIFDFDTVTIIHNEVQIGAKNENHNETVYGTMTLRYWNDQLGKPMGNPEIVLDVVPELLPEGETHTSIHIQFDPTTGKVHGGLSNVNLILPNDSANLVGVLNEDELKKNYITKSIRDNYIVSSSINEHVDEDGNAVAVEVESENLSVRNAYLRKLRVASDTAGEKFKEGVIGEAESYVDVIINKLQKKGVHHEVQLPNESGVLMTSNSYLQEIDGTEDRLAVFGAPTTLPSGETKCTVIDSMIVQKLDEYKRQLNASAGVDKDLIKSINLDSTAGYNEKAIQIEADTIIGDVAKDKRRSLLITGKLELGNSSTGFTHVEPGRSKFAKSTQYQDAFDESIVPVDDVVVEMPPVSGVLLTDNSRVDGLVWL